MTAHSKLDLNQLAKEISIMNTRKNLYKVLKRELDRLGYWKGLPRNRPPKGIKPRIRREEQYDDL